jgi:hypothetical protein
MLGDLDANTGVPIRNSRKRRSNENAWPFAPRYRDDPRLDHRARSLTLTWLVCQPVELLLNTEEPYAGYPLP